MWYRECCVGEQAICNEGFARFFQDAGVSTTMSELSSWVLCYALDLKVGAVSLGGFIVPRGLERTAALRRKSAFCDEMNCAHSAQGRQPCSHLLPRPVRQSVLWTASPVAADLDPLLVGASALEHSAWTIFVRTCKAPRARFGRSHRQSGIVASSYRMHTHICTPAQRALVIMHTTVGPFDARRFGVAWREYASRNRRWIEGRVCVSGPCDLQEVVPLLL